MERRVVKGDGDGEETEVRRINPPSPRGLKGIAIVCLLIIVLILLSKGSAWLVDWLWMREVGYTQIFIRLFSIRILLFFLAAVPVFVFLWINLKVAVRHRHLAVVELKTSREQDVYEFQPGPRILTLAVILLSLIPAVGFGFALSSGWDNFIRFFWGGSYGSVDPLFGKDMAFYLFRLPLYQTVQSSLTVLAAD